VGERKGSIGERAERERKKREIGDREIECWRRADATMQRIPRGQCAISNACKEKKDDNEEERNEGRNGGNKKG
jgi:hypothetical protein